MARSRDEEDRLDRLTGSGKGSGGGLPLPDLFSAFLVELLDNGPAPVARLVGIAADKLEYKTSRVIEGWGSWEALVRDVLQQMESRGFICGRGDSWGLGEKFKTGERLVVVPKRPGKNRNAIGTVVYPREEREERDRLADMKMTATELAGKLLPDGPGIRPVSRDQVERIRESLLAGVPRLYKVLVDKHGHVLDGKHRLAADPDWPQAQVSEAADDISALAVARAANMGQPLPPKVAATIDRVLGDSRAVREAQRGRIRAALVEDASRSNRQIAEIIGCGKDTVRDERSLLEQTGELSQFSQTGGRGIRTGTPAESRPIILTSELQNEITQALATGEISGERDVMDRFGLKTATAKTALRIANDRLRNQDGTPQQAAYSAASRLDPDEKAALAQDIADELPPEQQAQVVDKWLDQSPPPQGPAQPEARPTATHRPHAARAGRAAPPLVTTLMKRVQNFLGLWAEDAPEPDPSAELRELEEMRRVINERIAALRT